MIHASKVNFYLNEKKEEKRLSVGWFPPPPPNGYHVGMMVNIEGADYKVKDIKKCNNKSLAIVLEEISAKI